MQAAYVEEFNPTDPISAVAVGERPDPAPREGWVTVTVKAASLNHHDVFTARGGVIPKKMLPRIIGMDAAGIDSDGREVVVHNLVSSPEWRGHPLLDPGLTGLSEGYDGTLAEQIAAPAGNLVAKPASLSFEQAACLPTAWLTAYRMLFIKGGARAGDVVLVQGATGGVASALISLGRAAGVRMWATGRSEEKRAFARELGAELTLTNGARLPEQVSAVMETVGAPTWEHSLKSVRKGGAIVVAGGTGGYEVTTNLARVFTKNIRIIGSTMGTVDELTGLMAMLDATGVRPVIGAALPLAETAEGLRLMESGDVRGKIVVTV